MRNQPFHLGRGVAGNRLTPAVVPPTRAILTVTDGVEGALVTTAGPHGLAETSNILIAGSAAAYNGAAQVASIESATSFITDQTYTADAAGGNWSRA